MDNKKLFLGFGLLLVGFAVFSAFTSPAEKAAAIDRLEQDAYNAPHEVDLAAYLVLFVKEAQEAGVDVRDALSKPHRISFTNNTYGRALAVSWEKDNDESIVINVMREQWNNLSQAKKKYLMFHELGHDVLNLSHGETPMVKVNVPMNPSWETVDNQIKEMFEYYKNK